MMEEFVPYELALRLKNLGFDEPCFGYYLSDGLFCDTKIRKQTGDSSLAPTFSQAFRWFREKYDLDSYIEDVFYAGSKCYVFVIDGDEDDAVINQDAKDKHEEAELACLDKLISIIEQKEDK